MGSIPADDTNTTNLWLNAVSEQSEVSMNGTKNLFTASKNFPNRIWQIIKKIIYHWASTIHPSDAGMFQYTEINKFNTLYINKSNIIISIDTEEALDKIQHSFMLKMLNKIDLEATYLNC